MKHVTLDLKTFLRFITYDGLFSYVHVVNTPHIALALIEADKENEYVYVETIASCNPPRYIIWPIAEWYIEKERRLSGDNIQSNTQKERSCEQELETLQSKMLLQVMAGEDVFETMREIKELKVKLTAQQ